MINKIFRQIKSFDFWFALFFYLFVALTVSYGIFALVLTAENKFKWPPSVLMQSCVVGTSAGMLIVFFLSKIKMRLFSVHMGTFSLHPINVWFIVIVFGITIWMFAASIQFWIPLDGIKVLVENWATFLLILGSTVSISGLYVTGRSIQQYRRQITSFLIFAKRLNHMIQETFGDTNEDYVRIMAYTPIPGSLALEERTYHKLKDAMFHPDARMEIVCLNKDDLSKWFDKFTGKRFGSGIIEAKDIETAKKDIEQLITQVDAPDTYDKSAFASRHKSKRLNTDQLPDFYFFFSDTRAIVTTPFFFPETPDNASRDSSIATLFTEEPVEMIGFETTDAKIISNINKFYIRIREL